MFTLRKQLRFNVYYGLQTQQKVITLQYSLFQNTFNIVSVHPKIKV